jgi:hypothetical protein
MVIMAPGSHEFVDQKLREAIDGIEMPERETAAKKRRYRLQSRQVL